MQLAPARRDVHRQAQGERGSAATLQSLRVAVLVDLAPTQEAGGHVKCWQRLAEAAVEREDLDLTLHFSGARESAVEAIAPSVRHHHHRPLFSSDRLRFLEGTPDATDLAPLHVGLARALGQADVLHTTDAYFAFAKTAAYLARRTGKALVTSMHTDVPKYTRIFTARTVERLFGESAFTRFLLRDLRVAERASHHMERRLEAHLGRCAFALGSSEDDLARLEAVLSAERVGRLRRGIDRERFSPRHRDRAWMEAELELPPERVVVLYVGRVDASKDPLLLARALRLLFDRGFPVFGLFVGRGSQREEAQAILGPAGRCVGPRPPEALPRIYASADVFALPSTTELCPNVALEAKASGLPVVLSSRGGSAQMVRERGVDGLAIDEGEVAPWTAALEVLTQDPRRRAALGLAARADIEARWPSWRQVLEEDLIPVWRRARAGAARR